MTLIARYKFDGNTRDSAGTANGTASDVTWAPSQLVDGGWEARMDGVASRIDTAIQFTTETAAGMAAWLRPGEGAGHLIGQHDGTNGLAIEQTKTGKIRLLVNGVASAEATFYRDEYHHAVAVYDNGEATLYLDNIAVATVTEIVTWPAVPVTIGAREDESATIECDFADLRIYDQAITKSDVYSLVLYMEAVVAGSQTPGADAIPESVVSITADSQHSDGSLTNGSGADAIMVGNVGLAPAKFRNGIRLTQTDSDYYYVPYESSQDFGVGDFTVSFWIRLYSEPPSDVLPLSNYAIDGTQGSHWMMLLTGGNISFRIRDSSSIYVEVLGPDYGFFNAGLVMVTGERKGDSLRLYINDSLYSESPGALNVGSVDTGLPIAIGRAFTTPTIDGLIDNIFIMSRALKGGEVESLYNGNFFSGDPEKIFPHKTFDSTKPLIHPTIGWNPRAIPRIPNQSAIQGSGISEVQGTPDPVHTIAFFDQIDGSGGNGTPSGTVTDPARQGRIQGTVTDENGQPIRRRVCCFERTTKRIVREAWSDSTGAYRFNDLDPNKRFTVVAFDYTGENNAVIADMVQPEVPT